MQRLLSRGVMLAERGRWISTATDVAAATLHSHSGWAAGAALLRPPTERLLQLPGFAVQVAVRERLGLSLTSEAFCPHVAGSGQACNASMREGAHAHCCSGTLVAHTKLRHDPLVHEWAHILQAYRLQGDLS